MFLDFQLLGSKFMKFFISVLKWQVNSSSNLASFFIVMTHSSSVNFKFIHFLLWTKGSHQSLNFETFECSGENLPNFSCHFSNCKLAFFQILHYSSVSLKSDAKLKKTWLVVSNEEFGKFSPNHSEV